MAVSEVARIQSEDVTKKERRQNPVFLRREVDEYGFTPIEFRILHRVQRREDEVKGCYESVPSMARGVGVSEKTATRVLMVLSEARVIKEEDREGWTTVRRINPLSAWVNKELLPEIRMRIYPTKKDRCTTDTRDGGITSTTGVTRDCGPRTPRSVVLRTLETVVPRTPETHEGIPVQSSPIEVNPTKEIPRTQTNGSSGNEGSAIEPVVCVPIQFDLNEIRRTYAKAHRARSFPFKEGTIKNPDGWLVTAVDGRYDELLVLPWWREQQELEQRRVVELAQAEAAGQAKAAEQKRLIAEKTAERDKEEQRKTEERAREAPQRERQRLADEAKAREKRFEDCERSITHFPAQRDWLINTMLSPDEKADFQNRISGRTAIG